MNRPCSARNRAGKPCGRQAIQGGKVCSTHGGAAPQVKAAAQARLLAMVDPALVQLRGLLDSADSDSVKLAAIRDVLDRAGLKAPAQHEIAGQGGGPLRIVLETVDDRGD